ncbi:MAG TPA: DNA polymerase III subunit delta [Pseudomonadales bacterium]
MPIRLAELPRRLRQGLAPLYLVSGDETLLVEEACDEILGAARTAGYSERSVLFADGSFNWNDVLQDAASLSLFAERRIVDLRVAAGKLNQDAADVICRYLERPADDTLLLIRMPKLDSKEKGKAWFKSVDRHGVLLQIWPVGIRELPRWLAGRLERAGVALQPDALELLAERIEGNLLAAVQEIEKLRLSGLASPISAHDLMTVLGDSARYDVFELLDAVFEGDARRVSRMVRSLRQEGVAILGIVGFLTSQLRHVDEKRGPPQRQRLIGGFLRRIGGSAAIERILAECALIDAQTKGQIRGDSWLTLEDLLLRLAGTRVTAGGSPIRHLRA